MANVLSDFTDCFALGFFIVLYSFGALGHTHTTVTDSLTIRPSEFRTDVLCEFVWSAVYVC